MSPSARTNGAAGRTPAVPAVAPSVAQANGLACRRCGSELRAGTDGMGHTVWICDACASGQPAQWRRALVWYQDRVKVLELERTAVAGGTEMIAALRAELALATQLLAAPVKRVRRCKRCQALLDPRTTKFRQLCASCRSAKQVHPCQLCQAPVPRVHVGTGRYARFCAACTRRRTEEQASGRKNQRTGSLVLSVLVEARGPQLPRDIIAALPDLRPRMVYSALQHLFAMGRVCRANRIGSGWHYTLPTPGRRRSA